jgi:hypothetical protein
MEKNGINKEIRRQHSMWGYSVNHPLITLAFRKGFQAALTTTVSPSGTSLTVSPQACASSRV